MNIVNLQDIKLIHRNPLNSYMLTIDKSKREIKETIPFTIAMEWIKYLGINLHKETKDLYIEDYKTLMKQIKDGTNREIYHVHELEESIQWKWIYYPKQAIDSMQSLSSYQWYFSEN